MKTLYTTRGCDSDPYKIDIDDLSIQKIINAKQLLQDKELELAGIALPITDPENHFNFKVLLNWIDQGRYIGLGNSQADISKGQITIELGHYCYQDIFEYASTSKDILDLPDISFEENFLTQFLTDIKDNKRPWEVISFEHQSDLIIPLMKFSLDALNSPGVNENNQWNRRHLPFWNHLVKYSQDIIAGKRSYQDLILFCDENLSENLILNSPEGYNPNPEYR